MSETIDQRLEAAKQNYAKAIGERPYVMILCKMCMVLLPHLPRNVALTTDATQCLVCAYGKDDGVS